MYTPNIQPDTDSAKQLTFISDKKVYNKDVIDTLARDTNTAISDACEDLKQFVKSEVSAVYVYKGSGVYVGGGIDAANPPTEVTVNHVTRPVQPGDICRCTNNTVIQFQGTGLLASWKVLNDIHTGWVFNLTEDIIADMSFGENEGDLIFKGTNIAIVQRAPIQGCEWCWDAMTSAASFGSYNGLSDLPQYRMSEQSQIEKWRGDVSHLLAQPMTAQQLDDIWDAN